MQLTGHRNVQSINQYSSASLEQQETMSNILTDISCGNSGVSCNGNISSTSKQEDLQVPVIAKPSFDDDFPDVDFNEIVSDIENFENRNLVNPNTNPVHNQPTIIDLAPVLPNSKICLLPYAQISGNVTINLYGPSDNK